MGKLRTSRIFAIPMEAVANAIAEVLEWDRDDRRNSMFTRDWIKRIGMIGLARLF